MEPNLGSPQVPVNKTNSASQYNTTTPSNNGRKFFIFGILVIVILIFLGLIYWTSKGTEQSPTNTIKNPSAQIIDKKELESEGANTLAQAKIKFPPVAKLTQLSSHNLPADFTGMLLPEAGEVSISSINYTDGGNGIFANYTIPSTDLLKTETLLMNQINTSNKSWQQLIFSGMDYVGFFEYQNLTAQARIQLVVQDQNKGISVTIKTLNKTK